MGEPNSTKIIEKCEISPPPGSVSPITLPLTFFDFPWLLCIPMQRLFFFDHVNLHLPLLKHSLSLALRHFFPLAAVLVSPPPPLKPHLRFSAASSVSLTVAESSADFHRLLSDDPRDVTDSHPFVPELPPLSFDLGGATLTPLLALQVTVFPNNGVAIGATFSHVAADGRAFNHFVKSWALFCRTASTTNQVININPPPSHDRSVVLDLDPNGLESIFLNQWWAATSNPPAHTGRDPAHFVNKVRATFRMGRAHIDKLKLWVLAQCKDKEEALSFHASTFVVTVAFTWVQLIKSEQPTGGENEMYHLSFVADCRNRRGFGYSIPDTYFGNCLAICYVSVKAHELLGENGVLRAAKAIGERVKELDGGALRGADTWMLDWEGMSKSGKLVTVAGSPNLRVYDTDFGWGRPRKSEVVQIDVSGAIALAESKDEEGGIEIGLALNKENMKTFSALYEGGLELV